ncbi:MAG: ATP-binding cassette domain-containing protein [Rhizomicrobium sp.]
MAGKLGLMGGEMVTSRKMIPGYFAQHQLEELQGQITPIETLQNLRPKLTLQEVRTQLGGFGFSAAKQMTRVGNLSGGERARLMLALATLDKPNLLILDEPTNHLDIDARGELLTALNDFDGAVVLVSHDRRLIEATADRLLLVANGEVHPFDGDLDDYRKFLLSGDNTPTRRAPEPEAKPDKTASRRDSAERRRPSEAPEGQDRGRRAPDRRTQRRDRQMRQVAGRSPAVRQGPGARQGGVEEARRRRQEARRRRGALAEDAGRIRDGAGGA